MCDYKSNKYLIQSFVGACVCFCVESVGSSYEYHSRKNRDLSQQHSTRTVYLLEWSIFLDKADKLIKEAISAHWAPGKPANFVTRKLGDYTLSKTTSSKVEAHFHL